VNEPAAAREAEVPAALPFSAARRSQIEGMLLEHLPSEGRYTGRLLEALRSAVLAPGRRVRPGLVLAAAEAAGARPERVHRLACAVEYVHTAGLVLDDLPDFGDRTERRGLPCLHVAYDAATAVLAAEALLMVAFSEVARSVHENGVPSAGAASIVSLFAETIGVAGMIGGEFAELSRLRGQGDPEAHDYATRHRIADLFVFCAQAPAVVVGAPEDAVRALSTYGERLGRAYQGLTDLEAAGERPEAETSRTRSRAGEALREAGREIRGFGAAADGLHALVAYVSERVGKAALAKAGRSR